MSFLLGLTGSIGMGKSTTARFFADYGCPVWDADAAVHRLYSKDGEAVKHIKLVFPSAIENRSVSRNALRIILKNEPEAFSILEGIVHPLVAQDREQFIEKNKSQILVFDIPLLFETGGEKKMDAVACVFVDPDTQKQRVLERGTMSVPDFELILSKQMSITEKLEKSDYQIETKSMECAKKQVENVILDIQRSKL